MFHCATWSSSNPRRSSTWPLEIPPPISTVIHLAYRIAATIGKRVRKQRLHSDPWILSLAWAVASGATECVWMRGWSHWSVLTPFVGIFGCNSVKSGGPISIFEHNPQQFHGWKRMESLEWSGHESLVRPTQLMSISLFTLLPFFNCYHNIIQLHSCVPFYIQHPLSYFHEKKLIK